MDDRSRRNLSSGLSNHLPNANNMNPIDQQHRNNLGISEPNSINIKPLERFSPLNWNLLQGYNLERFLSPSSSITPSQRMTKTTAVSAPNSTRLTASNGIRISESLVYHHSAPPAPRNLNLPINLVNSLLYYDHQPNSELYDGPNHDNHRDQYQRHQRFLTKMERRGFTMIMAAKDRQGSAFLQDTLTQGSQKNIDVIFSYLKTDLCSLMMHQFGNLVIQKLIDVVDGDKLDEILDLFTTDSRFNEVCADHHGTQLVQKLAGRLMWISTRQSLLVTALSKNSNGNSVIYQCLRNFSPRCKQQLLRGIADNCLDTGQDQCGSHLLQKCFDEADDEIFNSLAPAVVQNAEILSKSFYGNYVVQHLIKMKKLEVNRNILAKLRGKFVSVSMNKNGRHVVQKLMNESGLEEVADTVLTEILDSSSPLIVSQDLYGNIIFRTAIRVIKEGPLFDRLRKYIEDNERYLRNDRHRKRVLKAMNARVRAMNESIDIEIISNL